MSIILSTLAELHEVCLFKLGARVNRVQKVEKRVSKEVELTTWLNNKNG